MRNSKVKGFTLIELIVVIAIIGVLAAILVPSMLGYVRNARISSANANAKQVHTAASSVLTQLGIDNFDWTSGAQTSKQSVHLDAASNGVVAATWTVGTSLNSANGRTDFISYLGDNFTGVGRAYFNQATYSVSVACWASTEAALTQADSYITYTQTNSVYSYKNACDSTTQKNDAKGGNLYGIYPQGEAAAAGSGT